MFFRRFCCKRLVALRPDLDLSDKPAQRRDHAQRHDAPGARILRRNAFDRHGEARGVGVDLDAVGVAGQRRIGPDFEPSLVRPDAGEAECRGDIDVGGKTARAFARALPSKIFAGALRSLSEMPRSTR